MKCINSGRWGALECQSKETQDLDGTCSTLFKRLPREGEWTCSTSGSTICTEGWKRGADLGTRKRDVPFQTLSGSEPRRPLKCLEDDSGMNVFQEIEALEKLSQMTLKVAFNLLHKMQINK